MKQINNDYSRAYQTKGLINNLTIFNDINCVRK